MGWMVHEAANPLRRSNADGESTLESKWAEMAEGGPGSLWSRRDSDHEGGGSMLLMRRKFARARLTDAAESRSEPFLLALKNREAGKGVTVQLGT